MNLLDVPEYAEAEAGGWRIVNQASKPGGHLPTYLSGIAASPKIIPTLYGPDGTLWMSITAMERESQYRHCQYATGNVIVAGAGMGLIVYNLLRNPHVGHVAVIEKDRALFENWSTLTGAGKWEGSDRLSIAHADVLECNGQCDTLIADIWPTLGDEALVKDMETMRRNMQTGRMMCWGAELEFICWCARKMLTADRFTARRWSEETGHYVWPEFADDALAAAVTAVGTVALKEFANAAKSRGEQ